MTVSARPARSQVGALLAGAVLLALVGLAADGGGRILSWPAAAVLLAVVAREDGYGYDVVRRLRAAGLEEVGDASVYGTLRRLYSAGALTSYVVPSDEGPHRKYYGINAQGRAVLETQGKTWAEFARTMDGLLDQAGVRS